MPRTNGLIEALGTLRETNEWSAKRLADEIGIEKSYLYRLFAGNRRCGRRTLHQIATRFPELQPSVAQYIVDGSE